MKIAFLNHQDPHDKRSWSGTLASMREALERHCGEVVALGPAGQGWYFTGKVIRRLLRIFLRRNIDYSHTVLLSKAMARIFQRRLSRQAFDVIFAPAASTEIAHLETDVPIVHYGDLTARLFRDYATHLVGLSQWSINQTEFIEGRALRRAAHLVYSSEWAARSAVQDYGVPKEKVSVAPIGANLEEIPKAEDILAVRSKRSPDSCCLLFIAVDWERKGGDVALGALRELRHRGVEATLTVVGCMPPGAPDDAALHVIPFLDKRVPEQRRQLECLLQESDFMLFPTRREAYGVVCCEANAYALPLIASDGGGVPVWNGENGILLSANASASDYADTVESLLRDPARYYDLARGGRYTFDTRLNWDSWGRSMASILKKVIATRTVSELV